MSYKILYAYDPKELANHVAMNATLTRGAVQIDETGAPVYKIIQAGTLDTWALVLPVDKARENSITVQMYALCTTINTLLNTTGKAESVHIEALGFEHGGLEKFNITITVESVICGNTETAIVKRGTSLDGIVALNNALQSLVNNHHIWGKEHE